MPSFTSFPNAISATNGSSQVRVPVVSAVATGISNNNNNNNNIIIIKIE